MPESTGLRRRIRRALGAPRISRLALGVGLIGGVVLALAVSLVARPAGAGVGPHRPVAPPASASTLALSTCQRPAPTTAAGYGTLFADLDPAQWGGGDGALTITLGRRTVWLFADTLSVGRFVHSSAIVQDGGCLHVSHGGAQLLPDEPSVTGRPRIFWVHSARAARPDAIAVTARAIDLVGNGPWDFRDAGYFRTALVTVDDHGDVTFARWLDRRQSAPPDPGPLLDCETPAPPTPHHLCYGQHRHPALRLAGGRMLVTVSQNWDDGVPRPLVQYQPLFRSA